MVNTRFNHHRLVVRWRLLSTDCRKRSKHNNDDNRNDSEAEDDNGNSLMRSLMPKKLPYLAFK